MEPLDSVVRVGFAGRSIGQSALFFASFLLGNRTADAAKEMKELAKLKVLKV